MDESQVAKHQPNGIAGINDLDFALAKTGQFIPDEVIEVVAFVHRDGTLLKLFVDNPNTFPYLPDYFIGKSVFDFIPESLNQKGQEYLSRTLADGQTRSFTHNETWGENTHYYDIRLMPHSADEVLVILRDLSSRREAERDILRLNRAFISLQSAAMSITGSLNLEHVLDTFVWELSNMLNASGCIVSQWNQDVDTVSVLMAYPHRNWCRRTSKRGSYPLSQFPLTGRVLAERHTQQIKLNHSEPDLPERTFMQQVGIHTLLLTPMVFQNQTVGLVEVISETERTFSSQEISLAQLLTNQAASAVVNARLYDQLGYRLQEVSTLNRISQAIASSLDLPATLTTVTEGTLKLMGVETVSVALLENDQQHLRFVAATGRAASFVKGKRLKLSKSIVGWVIQHGEPLLVANAAADPRHFPEFDKSGGFQTRSIICMPLLANGLTIGAISAINKQVGEFDEDDLRLLASLAIPATTAIENARLYQRARREIADRQQAEAALEKERASLAQRVEERTAELQRQYQRQRALAAIEPSISHPGELAHVLQQIVDTAETALPADGGASIVLVDEETKQFSISAASGKMPDAREIGFAWHSAGTSQKILETQQVVVVSEVDPSSATHSSFLRASGLRSYVGVPLIGQGRSLGIIYATSYQPRTYTQEALDFLSALANRAAVAIANVQLYEKLQQTNAELARAARMKDEFLASMSHELRTPLTAILGVTEGLEEQLNGSLNEKQRRAVQIIGESGRHLLSLINDILDVAKVESGRLELHLELVPVRKVCDSSLQFIRQSAATKQISVKLNVEAEVRSIYADPRRLKQILINLLSNAVKFTPTGNEIGLEVTAEPAAGWIHFTVWDTGIGIPESDMSRLFQPFVQLDSSLSRRFAGTGLGLTLVRRMAELHGGKVKVESSEGKGSRFTVSLPWKAAESSRQKPHSILQPADFPAEEIESGQASDPPGPRILLVDDDERSLEVFSEMLSLRGYDLQLARGGNEAIQIFEAEEPDLILMDIQMPDMDGLETMRRLRSHPRGKNVRIIALTALAMSGDRETCLAAGADDYLSKPVPMQKLVRTIQALLQQ